MGNDPLDRVDPTGNEGACLYAASGCDYGFGLDDAKAIGGFIPGSGYVEGADAAANGEYTRAAILVGMEATEAKVVKKIVGVVYKVFGKLTKSGRDYIGRTKTGDPATRGNDGGRVRNEETEIVDTYDPDDAAEGAYKEQRAMDDNGGVDKLDNKRREVSTERMKELENKYGVSKTPCTGSRIDQKGPC